MIPLKMFQMQGARSPGNEAYFSVRRMDEEIEATQQMGYFQRNHLRNMKKIMVKTILKSIEVARGK
jgi:hypothetical protein